VRFSATPRALKGLDSMWHLLVIAIVFVLPTLAWSENAEAADPQLAVHRALLQISKGAYGAENEKQIRRLGDAVAVAFTKEMGNRRMKWTDVENFLFLVHEAFAEPHTIQNQHDCEPHTSLFVLRILDSSPLADELKRSIADTRVFLEARQ
jgi:hypothetical protein